MQKRGAAVISLLLRDDFEHLVRTERGQDRDERVSSHEISDGCGYSPRREGEHQPAVGEMRDWQSPGVGGVLSRCDAPWRLCLGDIADSEPVASGRQRVVEGYGVICAGCAVAVGRCSFRAIAPATIAASAPTPNMNPDRRTRMKWIPQKYRPGTCGLAPSRVIG